MSEPKWTRRISKGALYLALAASAVAFLGLTLARYDLVAKMTGFFSMLGGALLAALALLVGLIALFLNWRFPSSARKSAWIATLLSAGFVGFIATRPLSAGDAPPLHDISTDLANPPQFQALSLREDNLAGVGTEDNWRKIHAVAYPGIEPLVVARPVAEVIASAERLARERGWDIVLAEPAAGRLEATASVSYIRFKDDVVLRVTPLDGDQRSLVDMRSVSRVGVGDLGVNAARITAFLKALSEAGG